MGPFVGCGRGLTCWSPALGAETRLTGWGGMSAASVVDWQLEIALESLQGKIELI